MSEAQHSKAPWRVGPVDDTVVSDADGHEVAAVDGDYNNPVKWPVMEANARLIAAAPEMKNGLLNASSELRKVTKELGAPGDYGYETPAGKALFAAHRALFAIDTAIAKAEGRT